MRHTGYKPERERVKLFEGHKNDQRVGPRALRGQAERVELFRLEKAVKEARKKDGNSLFQQGLLSQIKG